ncbi:MAG TPA: MetQ/NlpA family ABC transporter substrate-binding protein, partial [Variovorax sp.]
MHTSFRRRTLALATLAAALFAGSSAFAQDKNTLKVGVSVGNGEQIFEVVKKVAAKDGLNIQVVVFNDYQLP